MPQYYDDRNFHGIKITINPQNNLSILSFLKNFSRPVAVGDHLKTIFIMEKLDDYDLNYWENLKNSYFAIGIKLPGKNYSEICHIDFMNTSLIKKTYSSPLITKEGEIEIEIIKVIMGRSIVIKDLFSAKVENRDWKRYGWRMSLIGALIAGGIILLITYLFKIY